MFELFDTLCQVGILFSRNLMERIFVSPALDSPFALLSFSKLSKPSKKLLDDRKVSLLSFICNCKNSVFWTREAYRKLMCHLNANIKTTPYFLLSNLHCVLPNLSAPAHSLAANKLPESSALSLFRSCSCGVQRFLLLSLCVRLLPDS